MTYAVAVDSIKILVSLINLAEQFGIYMLQKVDSTDDEFERFFFFILFVIDAIDVLQCSFKKEKNKTIVAIIVDTCEVICYVAVLQRTTALYLVALLTYSLELLLNGVIIFLTSRCNDDTFEHKNKRSTLLGMIWDYFALHALRLLSYVIFQLPQFLFLFLQPESKFRETYYEIIAIIGLYFGAIFYDHLESIWEFALEKGNMLNDRALDYFIMKNFYKEVSIVRRIWNFFALAIIVLMGIFIIPITTIVLASIELHYNSAILPSFDRNVYMYFIVFNTVWYLFLIITPAVFHVKKNWKKNHF